MKELNLGDIVYYIDNNFCKIKTLPIIRKTTSVFKEDGKEVVEATYTVKFGTITLDFVDRGRFLISESNYVKFAFRTKEELIDYISN